MTAPAIALNPMGTQSAWPDSAISRDAEDLREIFDAARGARYSFALTRHRWELEAACLEASTPNWDGYGANPVQYSTYVTARRFLETLRSTPIDPDIVIDPDGEISLTWKKAAKDLFSVSVAGSGRLSYAGIFGAVNTHGTEYFIDQIPTAIKAGLARLFTIWR